MRGAGDVNDLPLWQSAPRLDGVTYDPVEDGERLGTQMRRVFRALRAGGWWTLHQLRERCGGSEAGISARIRDLRKLKFGSHVVDRRRCKGGLWKYRLIE